MVRITDELALEAAKTIKAFCKQHEGCCCGKCPLHNGDACSVARFLPSDWEIPTIPRWTKTDKALAEALRLAGVKKVFRKEGKLWLANDFYSMVDRSRIIDAFHDLKPDERISLEEIANSKGERADE